MKQQTLVTGYLLILAAITFWLAWFLMPDPGTTDTNHILAIVKASRPFVLGSVISQIISSVLYAIALMLLVKISFPRGKTLTGVILLGIGAMGMCSDSFFHLLAWFMTDDTVTRNTDVVKVMEFMQTDGIIFLLPLMLPFFIGGPLLAWGLYKQHNISEKPVWLFSAAFIVGIVTTLITEVMGIKISNALLTPLALFAIGQIATAYQLIKAAKSKSDTAHERSPSQLIKIKNQ